MRDEVLAYYRRGGETTRLSAGTGRLEFIRTWDARWGFTTAYFHHPDELPGEVAEADLELDRIVSVEGPLWIVPGWRGIPRGSGRCSTGCARWRRSRACTGRAATC